MYSNKARRWLMSILMALTVLPSMASWDWSDWYIYCEESFDTTTFVAKWNVVGRNDYYNNEGFDKGLVVSILLPGTTEQKHIFTVKTTDGGGMTVDITEYGKFLGIEYLGHEKKGKNDHACFSWKVPLEYINKPIRYHYEGRWHDWVANKNKQINMNKDLTYKADLTLSTPTINDARFTLSDAGTWGMDLDYTLSDAGNMDPYAVLYPMVSTADKKYESPNKGQKHADIKSSTNERSGTYSFGPADMVEGKATVPQLLRSGMALTLAHAAFNQLDTTRHEGNRLIRRPELIVYNTHIDPQPYPRNMTTTFISNQSKVRLTWNGREQGQQGLWRIYRDGKFIHQTAVSPDDQKTYIYEDYLHGKDSTAIFANGNVEYTVAWLPDELEDKASSIYIRELSETKQVEVKQYVRILRPMAESLEDRVRLTWYSTATDEAWGKKFEIWLDGTTSLGIVSPIGTENGALRYKWEHLSGAVEIPTEGLDYPYRQDNDLYECKSHTYTIRAYTDRTNNVYSEAEFPHMAVGCGMSFRSATVSQGAFANKVRVAATVSRLRDMPISFRVMRAPYASTETGYTEVFTQDNGSTSFSWDDIDVNPGSFYKYRIMASYTCEREGEGAESDTITITSRQVGFCQNTGIVSGQITYNGGTAAQGIELQLSAAEEGRRLRCYNFQSAGDFVEWPMPSRNYATRLASGSHTLQFWVKPTDISADPTSLIRFGNHVLSLSQRGLQLGSETILATPLRLDHWSQLTLSYDPAQRRVLLQTYTPLDEEAEVHTGALTLGEPFALDATSVLRISGTPGYYDDVRLWTRPLTERELSDSRDRYLSGEETGLELYWTFDEGLDEDCFDTSRDGSQSHCHNGMVLGPIASTNVYEGLSFRTRTDANGNYTLRGIPFDGDGVNYKLTPTKEGHTFAPEARNRFVSQGSLVHNATDFTDVSSFPFYGQVLYKHGNIPVDSVTITVDGELQTADGRMLMSDREGRFVVAVPIGAHKISLQRQNHTFSYEGTWPFDGEAHDFVDQVGRESDPILFTDETTVCVAGRVCGGDIMAAVPLCVQGNGSRANIGQGFITLQLASSAGYQINTGTEPIQVGGDVCEATLEPGSDMVKIATNAVTGEFKVLLPPVSYRVEEVRTKDFVSQGLYEDFGDLYLRSFTPDPSSTFTDELKDKEDKVIGTFDYNYALTFVRHNPAEYLILDVNRNIDSKTLLPHLGESTTNVNGKDFNILHEDVFNDEQGNLLPPSDPSLYMLGYPVFNTNEGYNFLIYGHETYYNRDDANEVIEDDVPLAGRELIIHNAFGSLEYASDAVTPLGNDSEALVLDEQGRGIYKWLCGVPNLQPPYRNSFSMTDVSTGQETCFAGYVFGAKSIEGSSFVTKGPDMVEFVVHDPYGTNSCSWVEKGSTITSSVSTKVLSDYYYLKQSLAFGIKYGYGTKGENQVQPPVRENNSASNISEDFLMAATRRAAPPRRLRTVTFLDLMHGANGKVEWSAQATEGLSKVESWFNNHGFSTATTISERISTSDAANYVGPNADVFVGNSSNILIGRADFLGLWLREEVAQGEYPEKVSLDDVEIAIKPSSTIGLMYDTKFVYTRYHIEHELLPELRRLRSELFDPAYDSESGGLYTLTEGHTLADFLSLDLGEATQEEASKLYTWQPPQHHSIELQDMALFYTQAINRWIEVLRDDERLQCTLSQQTINPPTNYSLSTGANYTSSSTASVTYSRSSIKRTVQTLCLYNTEEGQAGPIFGNFELQYTSGTTTNKNDTNTEQYTALNTLTWGSQLREDTRGNYLSQDVYTVQQEVDICEVDPSASPYKHRTATVSGSPVYILRAGQTHGPWQKAMRMHYVDLQDPGNPENIIGSDTQPVCMPDLRIANTTNPKSIEINHQPTTHDATIHLTLNSTSLSTMAMDYLLLAPAKGTVSGLELLVDGASIVGRSRNYRFKSGANIDVPLVVRRTRQDQYDFTAKIFLIDASQSDASTPQGMLADSVLITIHYDPTSSDVVLTPGSTIVNQISEGQLQLRVEGYDLQLDNFSCIDLMYRTPEEGDYSHTLARYWVSEEQQRLADKLPMTGRMPFTQEGLVGEQPSFVHNFDMRTMPDGDYDIVAVARSYYPNGAGGTLSAFEATVQSTSFTVRKDMVAPAPLGEPSPVSGLLRAQDEVCATFVEDINPNYVQPYRHVHAYLLSEAGEHERELDIDVSSDERHIYIDIAREQIHVQRRYVQFVVGGLRDMAGNIMTDSLRWEAYVDMAPLAWDVAQLSIVQQEQQTTTRQLTLTNRTDAPVQYALTSEMNELAMPNWLSVDDVFGVVPANGTAQIEFRVSPLVALGEHDATLYVRTHMDVTNELVEPLSVHLTCLGKDPGYEVNPADWVYNVNLIGQFEAPEGQFTRPGYDALYAFCMGSCVGKVLIPSDRRVMMTIHGSADMVLQPITFSAWDATSGTMYANLSYTYTKNGKSATITQDNAAIYGSQEQPVILRTGGERLQSINFRRGWNWMSLGVVPSRPQLSTVMQPLAERGSIVMKTATDGFSMTGKTAVGDLAKASIDATQMYMVHSSVDATIPFAGRYADAHQAITLQPEGWTWIGYPLHTFGQLDEALSEFSPTENDLIKSQQAFAMYYSGEWYGDLSVLQPGEGYKYHSRSATPVQLRYASQAATQRQTPPLSAGRASHLRRSAEALHWMPPTGQWSDNMTIVARLVDADGQPLSGGEVGSFVAEECRGVNMVDDEGYAFLVVQGNEQGAPVSFGYWMPTEACAYQLMSGMPIAYESDAMLGSPAEPVVLMLGQPMGITTPAIETDSAYYSLDGVRVSPSTLEHGRIYLRQTTVEGRTHTHKFLNK